MNDKPAACVIVPVLNGERTLGQLLAALLCQAGVPGCFEILVVDNGSTDRTVEIGRSHNVTLLHQPVRGPSAARNLGLARAKANVVVFTDADTVPSRRWLASLLAAFADPETILATGPIHGWQPATPVERYASTQIHSEREKTAAHPRHPFAHGMNVAVRRDAALAIGGWDETMSSGEDLDFALRLRRKFGKPIQFVEQAVLFHKLRDSEETLWKQARWHGAGYALAHQRHRDALPSPAWRCGAAFGMIAVLHCVSPFLEAGRRAGLVSAERAEFERYHRQYLRHFWGAFYAQWRKCHA
jgi:GT2 family glycosyltransferase